VFVKHHIKVVIEFADICIGYILCIDLACIKVWYKGKKHVIKTGCWWICDTGV
jgi:hypothetical protein